ncbi:histidine phosphatase superfamily [Dendryphion nanum]|uniref:Histidine phosphatase superfamily n=1 Tax=Dendryphion nanum TaxID=256645 RepID=A0A9P9IUU0_9PLEO|nr:histidine phosphatase superfamily [Dendryphion nanum]
MPSTIYLLRHAESAHNISKDFSHHDPPLTTLGQTQASQLTDTFPHPEQIAVIVTSPLRRAIQTALAGFSHVLDQRYYEPGTGLGVENGVRLVLDAGLQERSGFPCDTGSENEILASEFRGLDFGVLREGWQRKEGENSVGDEAVALRAESARKRLGELVGSVEGKDVVVVTHGVFMKFLSGEEGIDLPKAGWRGYRVEDGGEAKVRFVPVGEES